MFSDKNDMLIMSAILRRDDSFPNFVKQPCDMLHTPLGKSGWYNVSESYVTCLRLGVRPLRLGVRPLLAPPLNIINA